LYILLNTSNLSHLSMKRFQSVAAMYLNKKSLRTESFFIHLKDAKKTEHILSLRRAVSQGVYMASACRFPDSLAVFSKAPEVTSDNIPLFETSTLVALKLVTSTLLALLGSHRTSNVGGAAFLRQFEGDLIKEKNGDRILSAFFKVEAIAAYRFCHSGATSLLDIGIRSTLPLPAVEQKRQLIKLDRQGGIYNGDSSVPRILTVQIPVDAVQFEKLCDALSQRRRQSEFYFRASISKDRLRKILTSQYRKALKEKRERGFGVFAFSLAIEKNISSRRAVAELNQSGAFKDKIFQIEVGFNQSALNGAVRFSEHKNIGTKTRPMYQRLDTQDLNGKIPPVVGVCNKLVTGNG
jgi:hypothetical protein